MISVIESTFYSPRRFYGKLVQLLDGASKIEDPQKKENVKRFVNLSVGYARHSLSPREFQIPLLFEFSELGYTTKELRKMVVLK